MPLQIIGIMSGSSIDGLDIAICQFDKQEDSIQWQIIDAETVLYSDEWFELLRSAPDMSGFDLMKLDAVFGDYIGEQTLELINSRKWKADCLASHGHTVFHEPALGFTTQIGSGAHISFRTGLDTITSFRSADVAAGGQGAPFAPVADRALFKGYEGYLNLGGIANVNLISEEGQWSAWDISPCNQALNFLSRRSGLHFDKGGRLASEGAVLDAIRHELISMFPYEGGHPHGLSNTKVESTWISYLQSRHENNTDLISTVTTTIANVITLHISSLIKKAG